MSLNPSRFTLHLHLLHLGTSCFGCCPSIWRITLTWAPSIILILADEMGAKDETSRVDGSGTMVSVLILCCSHLTRAAKRVWTSATMTDRTRASELDLRSRCKLFHVRAPLECRVRCTGTAGYMTGDGLHRSYCPHYSPSRTHNPQHTAASTWTHDSVIAIAARRAHPRNV